MPRSPTTLDVFSAIAEPRRRRVLELLGDGQEQPVGRLVDRLGWSQPTVSKHLGVLRAVGLVDVRPEGREHLYRLNGKALRPVHEWTGSFERFWSTHLDNIQRRAEEKARRKAKEN